MPSPSKIHRDERVTRFADLMREVMKVKPEQKKAKQGGKSDKKRR